MGNHGKGCCKHCARVGLCFLLCTSWCLTLLLLLFDVYFLSSPLERCKPRDSRACPLSPCPSLVPVHSLKPGLVGDRMTGWLAAAQKSTADSAAGGVALPVGCVSAQPVFSPRHFKYAVTTSTAQNGAVRMWGAPDCNSLQSSPPSAGDSLRNQHWGPPSLGRESKPGPTKEEKQKSRK